ncbi:MAG: energy-dependent translational throttle protein EttA [Myxococcota bacterium]
MANQFICQMHDLRRSAGGKQIIQGISLSFFPGAKIGVIGGNGSGKSTLLKLMAGVDTEFSGDLWRDPSAKVGFLPQEPQLDETLTVQGNVELGLKEIRDLLARFNEISEKFAEPLEDDEMNALLEEQGELQDKIDAVNGWEFERMIEVAMDALRLPPPDSSVENLSGGEKRRVALCRLLLEKPDLLLLDEPTNHLDAESVAWLERHLQEFAGTVVLITHDRYFLDNVVGWILELDRGKGVPWEGNYSGWLEQKQERLAREEKTESKRRKTLARELDWIRSSAKARHAKNKARIQRYEELRREEADRRDPAGEIQIPQGPELGQIVIEAKNLTKAYDDKLLFDDLSFALPRGGIVGVVGPNGAGKTTLFKLLTDQENPDAGELRIGEKAVLAYVDQSRDALDASKTIYDEISEGSDVVEMGKREVNARAYVASFAFKGQDQQKYVGKLSGGERNRVHLAKMLKRGGNVLLLDEPTNDLDVETLRSLEEALMQFAGCAVVISHDRWFLDRIATHILAFEGNSHVEFFDGNFQQYEEDKKRRLGEDAVFNPRRIKYKPLSRG